MYIKNVINTIWIYIYIYIRINLNIKKCNKHDMNIYLGFFLYHLKSVTN